MFVLVIFGILLTYSQPFLIHCVSACLLMLLSFESPLPANALTYIIRCDVINPLLTNGLSFTHPPVLYFAVAYFFYRIVRQIFALSSLFWKYDTRHVHSTCGTILLPFIVSLTLYLGSFWAQQESTWSGWWAWEVSENILLMFWLSVVGWFHLFVTPRTLIFQPRYLIILLLTLFCLKYLTLTITVATFHSFFQISTLTLDSNPVYILIPSFSLLIILVGLWVYSPTDISPTATSLKTHFLSSIHAVGFYLTFMLIFLFPNDLLSFYITKYYVIICLCTMSALIIKQLWFNRYGLYLMSHCLLLIFCVSHLFSDSISALCFFSNLFSSTLLAELSVTYCDSQYTQILDDVFNLNLQNVSSFSTVFKLLGSASSSCWYSTTLALLESCSNFILISFEDFMFEHAFLLLVFTFLCTFELFGFL